MTQSEDQAQLGLIYSAKAEQTAKGVRITVHVYGQTIEKTATDTAELMSQTEAAEKKKGYSIAPVEGPKP